ncbi:CRR6 family NdhI maturation factor [Synechococcales cyanobacterium C]|uniref:CRR6 family NdhI maturation factor n=1 Tax=Petrachloros mirabilis ULC683 TaxID=2781853 RepID=A0A8K1ZXJ0_9CYAN|nr:CRR6 family NdhI maturation factor [Petrachloros mirabilis]NCJ05911.1 CRR6 family NdhI maturation factor [Petrachloros mirabilis ULC683]
MATVIAVEAVHFETLDLSPAQTVIESWLKAQTFLEHEQTLSFEVRYPQTGAEPVECPQIPEVRLWFVRLDSRYPWLPFFLNWREGELTRYAAMLVPHEFSPDLAFNPQALDLFVMHKIFTLSRWLRLHDLPASNRLKKMTEMFGYELEADLFQLLDAYPD